MKKNVIFVCTGNTCRSPMAEGFFKAALEADEALGEAYTSSSAGLSAYCSDPASPNAVQVLKDRWNIDISDHRASCLTGEAVKEAFLVLTMKEDHKQSILLKYPEAGKKVYTLKEYAYGTLNSEDAESVDISDPFCGSLEVYDACALEIKRAVEALAEKLKKS